MQRMVEGAESTSRLLVTVARTKTFRVEPCLGAFDPPKSDFSYIPITLLRHTGQTSWGGRTDMADQKWAADERKLAQAYGGLSRSSR